MICCFTGHRSVPPDDMDRLGESFDRVIWTLVRLGANVFRAGGARGFDTFAALKILEIKREYPNIRLELILPCKNQTDGWSEYNRSVYDYVVSQADSVSYVEERYVSGCMHKRNRALVDGADVCIAYCKSKDGGAAYTVNYAKKQGLKVIIL